MSGPAPRRKNKVHKIMKSSPTMKQKSLLVCDESSGRVGGQMNGQTSS